MFFRLLVMLSGWLECLRITSFSEDLKQKFEEALAQDLGICHYPQEFKDAIVSEGFNYYFTTANCTVKDDSTICFNPMDELCLIRRSLIGYLPFSNSF